MRKAAEVTASRGTMLVRRRIYAGFVDVRQLNGRNCGRVLLKIQSLPHETSAWILIGQFGARETESVKTGVGQGIIGGITFFGTFIAEHYR